MVVGAEPGGDDLDEVILSLLRHTCRDVIRSAEWKCVVDVPTHTARTTTHAKAFSFLTTIDDFTLNLFPVVV